NVLTILTLYAGELDKAHLFADSIALRTHWNAFFEKNETRDVFPFMSIYRAKNLLSIGHENYLQNQIAEAEAAYATAGKLIQTMPTHEKRNVGRYLLDFNIKDSVLPASIKATLAGASKSAPKSEPVRGAYFTSP